ncbi:type II toxin-antitoxin system RelE/ParE family toxin [uncultured Algoriphagus sp.]|uniref:type II toxin-antitoxin system RelE/ParE family toxin n=1 Tax=uncultured Algoriphagus sp. TaxID=417365 RepID=UPI0030EE1B56|tara:strand:- start:10622 stop:10942 length:321 start_codon:yes stop_codon:yes gene_type:complete
MANHKQTKGAVLDLANSWDYIFDMGAENQADKYYESLIGTCQVIAYKPALGQSYEGITKALLGMRSNRHIIFYRKVNEDYVEITRILHERIDLRNRLLELDKHLKT